MKRKNKTQRKAVSAPKRIPDSRKMLHLLKVADFLSYEFSRVFESVDEPLSLDMDFLESNEVEQKQMVDHLRAITELFREALSSCWTVEFMKREEKQRIPNLAFPAE